VIVVCPPHEHHDPAHLEHVAGLMRVLGPPVLRGYQDPATGVWLMREGTHRLRAAMAQGLAPVIVPVRWWRSRASLHRARYAARQYGHWFPTVVVGEGEV
jgi:hypothetical protein